MRIATRGLLVDCVRAPLSCFCFDQQERISSDPAARLAGIEGFLAKWRPTIDASGGSAAFHRFRNRYYVAAAVPLFVAALKAGRAGRRDLAERRLHATDAASQGFADDQSQFEAFADLFKDLPDDAAAYFDDDEDDDDLV